MVTFGLGFAAILLAVLLANGAMLLVRRQFDIAELRLNHDVADPLLSVVGTLFSILLGFLVAGAIQRFDEARIYVQEEAGAVAEVFRESEGLPPAIGQRIQRSCIEYVNVVIEKEWKLMEDKKASDEAWNTYGDIWRLCVKFVPQNEGESNVHQALLQAISHVGNYRTLRFAAMNNQLPFGMWLIVIVGGVATIIFTFFFEVKNERMQILMTSLVATVMALNVFLLANYDYPFSGDVNVRPTAFELDRDLFHRLQQTAAP